MSKEQDILKGAKRRIHEFKFGDNESDHVSLVDSAANGRTVLTMKASEPEVQVSLSMRDFLQKFFDMWSDDASMLAKILGYSGDPTVTYDAGDTYDDYINNQVDQIQLLKGQDLPDKLPESMTLKIETLMKNIGDSITSEDLPLEADNLKGDSKLSEVKIDKDELATLKAAASEVETLKSAASEVEILKAQLEEMDTLKSLVASLKQEKADKEKTEMVTLVKGYSFIPEDEQEQIVDFLLKAEDSAVFIKALEKARDAVSAVTTETGVEGGGVDLSEETTEKSATNDLVSNILSARNTKS